MQEKNDKIKISVIVPIYNASKYLSKCISSIINQSYKNLEIILVNDGSTDNSGTICDDYKKMDNRIIVIHKENKGVSLARNSGIKKASGEYICFIDADDIVHPDYIKKMVKYLDNDTLTACLIKDFKNDVIYYDTERELIKVDKNHFIDLCEPHILNTPCCKLYKLDIIKNNKIDFDINLSLGEDLLFNFEYLKYINKVFIVNQELYFYRKNDNNTLSTAYNPEMIKIQYLLFDKFTDFFQNNLLNKKMVELYDSYRFTMITTIIENEFKNKKISFFQRYNRARVAIKDNEMQKRIRDIHYPKKRFRHFLLTHKLVLIYKIVNKINNTI